MLKSIKELKRLHRLIFPSPAERRFVRVMGWGFFLLHDVKREYRAEGYMIDFALLQPQYIAIEIDGKNYHGNNRDVVRDYVLEKAGWNILRIPARRLWTNPDMVRKQVKLFVRDPHKWQKKYG